MKNTKKYWITFCYVFLIAIFCYAKNYFTCCLVGWLFSANHFWSLGISVSGSKHILILGLVIWRWSECKPEKLENELLLTPGVLIMGSFDDLDIAEPKFLEASKLFAFKLSSNPFKSRFDIDAVGCSFIVNFGWNCVPT